MERARTIWVTTFYRYCCYRRIPDLPLRCLIVVGDGPPFHSTDFYLGLEYSFTAQRPPPTTTRYHLVFRLLQPTRSHLARDACHLTYLPDYCRCRCVPYRLPPCHTCGNPPPCITARHPRATPPPPRPMTTRSPAIRDITPDRVSGRRCRVYAVWNGWTRAVKRCWAPLPLATPPPACAQRGWPVVPALWLPAPRCQTGGAAFASRWRA